MRFARVCWASKEMNYRVNYSWLLVYYWGQEISDLLPGKALEWMPFLNLRGQAMSCPHPCSSHAVSVLDFRLFHPAGHVLWSKWFCTERLYIRGVSLVFQQLMIQASPEQINWSNKELLQFYSILACSKDMAVQKNSYQQPEQFALI